MYRILILFAFLTLLTTTQAEEIWQRLDQPRVDGNINGHFQIDEKTYVSSNDGVFEFEDGKFIPLEDTFFKDKGNIYSLRTENGKGVMSCEAGIYYLENKEWKKCEGLNNQRQLKDLSFVGNKVVARFDISGRVFYSNNFGKNWDYIAEGKDTFSLSAMYQEGDTIHCKYAHKYIKIYDGGDTLAYETILVKSPYSFRCIYVDGTVLYSGDSEKGANKSTDYGITWQNIYPGGWVKAITKLGDVVYVATQENGVGIYDERDESMSKKSKGIPNTGVSDVFVHNGYVYANTWQGLYRTNNEMDGWENVSYQSNVYTCYNLEKNNDHLFAMLSNNGIKRSSDKGKSWSDVSEALAEDKISIMRLAVKDDIIIAYHYKGGIIQVSNDYGLSWKIIDFPGKSLSVLALKDITITEGRIIIAMYGQTYYSDDIGENWTIIDDETIAPSIATAIKFNYIEDKLFLGTESGGLFYTENKGSNWNKFDFGDTVLNKLKIKTLKIYGDYYYMGTLDTGLVKWNSKTKETVWFSDSLAAYGYIEEIYKLGNNIIVLTNSNVFLSKDNGVNWESVSSGIHGFISDLRLIDDTFYIGAWGGLFTTTFEKLGIVLTSVEAGPSVNIASAYPQPANDVLRIELDNSAMKNRSLSAEDITIYDANGRLLANQDITIDGNKELIWLCKDVRAGVYFIAVAGKTVKVIIN